MKLKVLIAALFVAGFASSFALAGGTRGAVDTTGTTGTTTTDTTATTTTTGTTTGTTTTTPRAPKCQEVELQGSDGSGSVTFTVTKASKKGKALAGKPVTLTIAAGATVHANACIDAAGALTLRQLELKSAKTEKKKDEAKSGNDNKAADKQKGQSDNKGKKG